jgi:hypothetical protein
MLLADLSAPEGLTQKASLCYVKCQRVVQASKSRSIHWQFSLGADGIGVTLRAAIRFRNVRTEKEVVVMVGVRMACTSSITCTLVCWQVRVGNVIWKPRKPSPTQLPKVGMAVYVRRGFRKVSGGCRLKLCPK